MSGIELLVRKIINTSFSHNKGKEWQNKIVLQGSRYLYVNNFRAVLWIFIDTMILDRIDDKETSELMISATTQHLNKFATEGLRTLCLAYKPVQPDFCEQWMVCLYLYAIITGM